MVPMEGRNSLWKTHGCFELRMGFFTSKNHGFVAGKYLINGGFNEKIIFKSGVPAHVVEKRRLWFSSILYATIVILCNVYTLWLVDTLIPSASIPIFHLQHRLCWWSCRWVFTWKETVKFHQDEDVIFRSIYHIYHGFWYVKYHDVRYENQ